MIPSLLAAAPLAGAIANGVFNAINSPSSPPANTPSFSQQLDNRIKVEDDTSAATPAASIQKMLAKQRTQGLSLQEQISLGQQLVGKTAQIADSCGNNMTGQITGIQVQNNGVQVTMNGKNHPLTAVQTILPF
ncbi:MAG: hypothetical protein PHV34_17020 [Verrucomicrobiae bacterium]|nr:hypothetical protein [Verrucomicrobiae bacterium]